MEKSAGKCFRQVSDDVGHHGHGGDALIELANIKFVHCVGIGVVIPKIFFPIDLEVHHRHAAAHELEDVGSTAAFVDATSVDGVE